MTRRPTHKNVLGYLQGLIDSVFFLNPYLKKGMVTEPVWKSVSMMKYRSVKTYRKLESKEREYLKRSMNKQQRLYFMTFIEPEAEMSIKTIIKDLLHALLCIKNGMSILLL